MLLAITHSANWLTSISKCVDKSNSSQISIISIADAQLIPNWVIDKERQDQAIGFASEKNSTATFSFYGDLFLVTGNCGPQYNEATSLLDGKKE